MALKLRVKKETIEISYREDNDNPDSKVLATFFVSPMTPTELETCMKKHEKKEWISPNRKTKKELVKDINFMEVQKDRIVATIVDWKGIEDTNGKALKCSDENKLAVWEHNSEVINWVIEQVEIIQEGNEDQKATEVKN
jgi:hypothetical protein